MGTPSSSRIPLAARDVHELQPSLRSDRARYLSARHEPLNKGVPAFPVDRESTGRIVSLGTGRFGVLAPRAPKQRFRRPIAAVDSVEEGQRVLKEWRDARDAVVKCVAWLASFLPRAPHPAKVLGVGMSGVRARPRKDEQ